MTLLQPMDQGMLLASKLYYTRQIFKILLDIMDFESHMKDMQCWKILYIAESISVKKLITRAETIDHESTLGKICIPLCR